MKKTLFALAVGTTAFSALATDGTFSASSVIGGVRQYVYDCDGTTKLATTKGAVQFVFNGTVVGAGTYNFISPGTFSAGTIGIPNQAGNTIQLTIDVWDKTVGATYELAALSGAGISQTITITLGGAGSPPATAAALTGYTGGTLLCPEPSMVALAGL
ncbi:MAG TPA: hypothetical protein VMB21_08770, partial [Candidatus Limnocylindria bacterium]|nr:hypothetical protein [Candidatus Limnocylindria bacterium]